MVTQDRVDEIMVALAEDMDVLDTLTPSESIAVHADALANLEDPLTADEREFYSEVATAFESCEAVTIN